MKKLNGQVGKQLTNPSPVFKEEELLTALQDVELMMNSILTPFVLLGETARCAYDNLPLTGSRIVVGITKAHITPESLSTLKTQLKDIMIQDNGFTYNVGKVPVTVKFIRNHYKFFDHPDKLPFMWDFYDIPNPFELYWEQRYFIK